jgi:hypothetical protein
MARYDKRDPDPGEAKLTRAGHYLWLQHKNRKLGLTDGQQLALLGALQIIWSLKGTLKAELAAERSAKFAEFKAKGGFGS